MFPQNEGTLDRALRVVVGIVLVPVGLFALGGATAGVLGVLVAAFGTWVLLTGASGFCPLYVPLKISTVGNKVDRTRPYASAH